MYTGQLKIAGSREPDFEKHGRNRNENGRRHEVLIPVIEV
jgi:hypothetical protein